MFIESEKAICDSSVQTTGNFNNLLDHCARNSLFGVRIISEAAFLTRPTWLIFTLKMESVSKNDGEKWSRKIYFEIPPCGKMVMFFTEFVILDTFMK